jgi:hypothetical protein
VAEISLAVTKAVLDHTRAPRERERQIAYKDASAEISGRLGEVTKQKHEKVRLAGRITLVVGDRGAIWRAHNEQYAKDFDALFTLLAQYPSQYLRFLCEITE